MNRDDTDIHRRQTTVRLGAIALAVVLSGMPVAPAVAQQQATASRDAATQAALQARRAAVQAHFATEQSTCMRRFFVNACLDRVRKEEGTALGSIDAQLAALGLRGRMRAAEAEFRRVQANMAQAQAARPDSTLAEREAARRESDLGQRRSVAAQRAVQAAETSAAPKVPRRQAVPVRLFPAVTPPAAPNPVQRAQAEAQAQADYAAKQRAYRQKQAALTKQNASQGEAPALPVPPASVPPGKR